MNRELYHQDHRRRRLLAWLAFYAFLLLVIIVVLYYFATTLRTRTLPVGQIQLVIPHSVYLVGEPITFQITNALNAPVYVINKCPQEPLAVYRYEHQKWVHIHDTASIRDCPQEDRQVSIAANSTLSANFNAWHHLFDVPGKYRIAVVVEHYAGLPYQDFEIIAKPAPAPAPTPIPYRRTPTTATPPATPTIRFTEPGDD